MNRLMCWTDYPLWLSAIPFENYVNKQLPWPEGEPHLYHVELVSYDGNKYAIVRHEKYGLVEFKAGYLYPHAKFKQLKSKCLPLRTLKKPCYLNAILDDGRKAAGVVGI